MNSKKKLIWRLVTIAVVVFLVGAGIYFLFDSTSESKQLEQQLIDQYGRADEYTPPADGTIEPERIEHFLLVREAVQTSCVEYQEVLGGIIGLEEIETKEDVSGREVASAGVKAFKSMLKVGPGMLRFMDARNSTLLAGNMGIGEYMYLYITAYGEQLAKADPSLYVDMEESFISSRTRKEYLQILHNQLDALETANRDNADEEWKTRLSEEITALEEGNTQVTPWPQGAFGKTAQSLAPFRERLSELYCEGVVAIELLQKNRGLRFGG
jgi:hypothetical protein